MKNSIVNRPSAQEVANTLSAIDFYVKGLSVYQKTIGGSWYWDYCNKESSKGFDSPVEALANFTGSLIQDA